MKKYLMKKLNEIINILIRLVVNLSERCIYISLIFEPNKALYTVLSDLFLKLLRNLRSLRRKDICKCKLDYLWKGEKELLPWSVFLPENTELTKELPWSADLFLDSYFLIIAYYISLVKVQTNYCNNNLLILDVKQLNKIMKLYYFYTLNALWDGQGKIKMYYEMSRVKKQLSGKKSIACKFKKR